MVVWSWTGSWPSSQVSNRVLAMRLVQRLGWVIETQERKKDLIECCVAAKQPPKKNIQERRKDRMLSIGPSESPEAAVGRSQVSLPGWLLLCFDALLKSLVIVKEPYQRVL